MIVKTFLITALFLKPGFPPVEGPAQPTEQSLGDEKGANGPPEPDDYYPWNR